MARIRASNLLQDYNNMSVSARPCVLTVAGSDSGGGAGIQADLKTFHAHGVHGTNAITAVTSQNTRAVTAVHGLPSRHIHSQLQALRDDFPIRAWKTGMLADARTIRAVAAGMAGTAADYVLDPVMISTSGASLLQASAVSALRNHLLPRATLVTPNLPEAAALSGLPLGRRGDLDRIAANLLDGGAGAVLIKGGHQRGPRVIDRLYVDGELHTFEHPRLARNGHGHIQSILRATDEANCAIRRRNLDACILRAAERRVPGPVERRLRNVHRRRRLWRRRFWRRRLRRRRLRIGQPAARRGRRPDLRRVRRPRARPCLLGPGRGRAR